MVEEEKRVQGNVPENNKERNTGARTIWGSLIVRVISHHVCTYLKRIEKYIPVFIIIIIIIIIDILIGLLLFS